MQYVTSTASKAKKNTLVLILFAKESIYCNTNKMITFCFYCNSAKYRRLSKCQLCKTQLSIENVHNKFWIFVSILGVNLPYFTSYLISHFQTFRKQMCSPMNKATERNLIKIIMTFWNSWISQRIWNPFSNCNFFKLNQQNCTNQYVEIKSVISWKHFQKKNVFALSCGITFCNFIIFYCLL